MMATVRPWGARFVGLLWLLGGGVLLVAGGVVVVDQHDVLRVEFLAGVLALLVGWQVWTRSVVVDPQGIEDRAGRHRQRLLWSTVERVAVGSEDHAGGPVTVWHAGSDDPMVLRGSWGTSRSQRIELVEALRTLVGPFGITVTSDVDADLESDSSATRPAGRSSGGTTDTDGTTWTARGPTDG